MSITKEDTGISNLVTALVETMKKTWDHAKTFSQCPVRFDGTPDPNPVDAFIRCVTIFKKSEKITDENSLESLPMVLTGSAATWWKGKKQNVQTWEKACELFQGYFAPPQAAHKTLHDLVKEDQSPGISTDQYITQKRAMIARLPDSYQLSKEIQIDLINGSLRRLIREKVPRSSIKIFVGLLVKGRTVEEFHQETRGVTFSAEPTTNFSISTSLYHHHGPVPLESDGYDDVL